MVFVNQFAGQGVAAPDRFRLVRNTPTPGNKTASRKAVLIDCLNILYQVLMRQFRRALSHLIAASHALQAPRLGGAAQPYLPMHPIELFASAYGIEGAWSDKKSRKA
jgi:hypothetical protein